MADKFSKAMGLAEVSPANIEETHIVARAPAEEHRSRKAHTFLKPSEFEAFVARIGRESVSSALRDLVLDFLRREIDFGTSPTR